MDAVIIPADQFADLIQALAALCLLGAALGVMIVSAIRDASRVLGRWLDRRAKPPSPYMLNQVARAMRARAAALDIKAEKLRLG